MHADLDRACATLLVAFGGLMSRFAGIPIFEFFTLVEREDPRAKRLFLRDLEQAWYLHGVEGAGSSPAEVAAWLRTVPADTSVERMVTIGASAGGFAALLFGALAGAAEVHAFAPQTFLDRFHRARHLDLRNRPQMAALRRSPRAERRFFDLKPVFAGHADSHPATRYVIHYARRNRLDAVHALRMKRIEGVELREYPILS